jgi:hypothetical protein
VARLRRFFRMGPDGQGSGSGVLLKGRQEGTGQVAIIDPRQEKIRQEGDKAKGRQQRWLPVDDSPVGVTLHPRLSGLRLKTHSVAFDNTYGMK